MRRAGALQGVPCLSGGSVYHGRGAAGGALPGGGAVADDPGERHCAGRLYGFYTDPE